MISPGSQMKMVTSCVELERAVGLLSAVNLTPPPPPPRPLSLGLCGDVGVLLLHLADGAFNESERSGRCQENNPEELEATARLMLSVCVRGPWEDAADSAAH